MLFNSVTFLIFFPAVCLLYFATPSRHKNLFLLIASYYFYLNWEPMYGILIIFSTLVSYFGARYIETASVAAKKKAVCLMVICSMLLLLCIFKYGNFLADTVTSVLILFNIKIYLPKLTLLLPVGISFYTFQNIAYIIDVYNKKIKAERDFIIFSLFVAFFPPLIAGPILRASVLLPQFKESHPFNPDKIIEGLKLMLWGYFMKLVIADRLSILVDSIYNSHTHHSGPTLAMATVFFAFQIYCDFAGYSNIAIGTAKVLGFDLTTNFRRPYLATSVSEFWRRWHITLSTWFKDYVYIPLGGNRVSAGRGAYNLLVTFVISGLWHGANWTFILWGALNGIYQVLHRVIIKILKPFVPSFTNSKLLAGLNHVVLILITFVCIDFAWIFFRANSVGDAFDIVTKIVLWKGTLSLDNIDTIMHSCFGVFLLMLSDILEERNNGENFFLSNKNTYIRFTSYIVLFLCILEFGVFDGGQFIYFQF